MEDYDLRESPLPTEPMTIIATSIDHLFKIGDEQRMVKLLFALKECNGLAILKQTDLIASIVNMYDDYEDAGVCVQFVVC